MADKDFNKELTESGVYQIAHGIGIDISTYKADSADSLKDALAEIKHLIQKRQYENTEAQNAADFKKLEDKPNLQQQYQEIKKEEKPIKQNEKENAEQEDPKEQETKEKPVSMREKLSLLSGRPTKSSASKTSALQNSLNQMEKTTARTLNTVALMLRNARGQKRP